MLISREISLVSWDQTLSWLLESSVCRVWLQFVILSLCATNFSRTGRAKTLSKSNIEKEKKGVESNGRDWEMKQMSVRWTEFLWDLFSHCFYDALKALCKGNNSKWWGVEWILYAFLSLPICLIPSLSSYSLATFFLKSATLLYFLPQANGLNYLVLGEEFEITLAGWNNGGWLNKKWMDCDLQAQVTKLQEPHNLSLNNVSLLLYVIIRRKFAIT